MSLPKPVLSYDDIVVVQNLSTTRLIWNTWSEDPIKAAVLRAILNYLIGLEWSDFVWNIAVALGQNTVCSSFLRFHWN